MKSTRRGLNDFTANMKQIKASTRRGLNDFTANMKLIKASPGVFLQHHRSLQLKFHNSFFKQIHLHSTSYRYVISLVDLFYILINLPCKPRALRKLPTGS